MSAAPQCLLTPIYDYRDYLGYRNLIDHVTEWHELDKPTQERVKLEATRYNLSSEDFELHNLKVTLQQLQRHFTHHDEMNPDYSRMYHWDIERGLRMQLYENNVSLFLRCILATDPELVKLLSQFYLGRATDDSNDLVASFKIQGYHRDCLALQSTYNVISLAIRNNDVPLLQSALQKHIDIGVTSVFTERMVKIALTFDADLTLDYLLSWLHTTTSNEYEREMAKIANWARHILDTEFSMVRLCYLKGSVKCVRFLGRRIRESNRRDLLVADFLNIRYPCMFVPLFRLYDFHPIEFIYNLTCNAIKHGRIMTLIGLRNMYARFYTRFSWKQSVSIREALDKADPEIQDLGRWALYAYLM